MNQVVEKHSNIIKETWGRLAVAILVGLAAGWLMSGWSVFAHLPRWGVMASCLALALGGVGLLYYREGEYLTDYSRPIWKIVDALLALAVGVVITFGLKSDDVTGNWPYWVILICSGLIYAGIKLMQHDIESQKQTEFQSLVKDTNLKQGDLTHLLSTMPPSGVMRTFTHSFLHASKGLRVTRLDDQLSISDRLNQLRGIVRACLNGAARLYLQYEHKPLSNECYAHWLKFYSMDDLKADKDLMQRVRDKIDFVDDPTEPLHRLQGVLHVDPDLTVVVKADVDDREARDDLAQEVFLPVPEPDADNPDATARRAIPIGPEAFVIGRTHYSSVSEELTEEAMRGLDVNTRVVRSLVKYFHEDQRIGSAVAFRLSYDYEADGQDGSGLPLGAVVIFTRDEHTKDGRGAMLSYVNICKPIFEVQTEAVYDMVLARDELLDQQSNGDDPSHQEV